MEKELDEIVAYASQQADAVATRAQLESLKAEVSGPNGRLTGVMKGMKTFPRKTGPRLASGSMKPSNRYRPFSMAYWSR